MGKADGDLSFEPVKQPMNVASDDISAILEIPRLVPGKERSERRSFGKGVGVEPGRQRGSDQPSTHSQNGNANAAASAMGFDLGITLFRPLLSPLGIFRIAAAADQMEDDRFNALTQCKYLAAVVVVS